MSRPQLSVGTALSVFGRHPKPSKVRYEFKLNYTFIERKKESTYLLKKYNNTLIPTIVQKSDQSNLDDIDKHKFLFKKDSTFRNIMAIIRKRLKVKISQPVYFFINNDKDIIPKGKNIMEELYKKYRDQDLFLYITYY